VDELVVAGFLAAAVVEAVVPAGLVVLAAVVVLVLPGATDWRRAGPPRVEVLFSLSDIDARGRWVAVVVVPGAAGFLTVVPAGGRVGGCLSPLAGFAAVVDAIFDAAVPLVVRRRAVDVAVVPGFALGDEMLVGLEPLVALFLGVD
jgi:hypothetical protein